MKKSLIHGARHWVQNRPLVAGLALAAVVLAGLAAQRWFKPEVVANEVHVVKKGDLLISVVEGGALRAVNESIIRSEFEGSSRIISIVPEGTYVKKGDLLVELDSSELREKVNQQEVAYQNSDFAFVTAKENLRIRKSMVESQIKDYELRVEFARSDLEKYKEGDAPQERKNAEASITLIEEELQRAKDTYEWTQELHKKGYASKSQLEGDSLNLKRLQLQLDQAKEDLRLLIKYDQPKNIRRLESALDQAEKELERLRQRTASEIAQAEADLRTRERALELTLERLNEQKRQLEAAKIHAPQDGLVVYATSSGGPSRDGPIEEGASVRHRQEIIKLPDVSQMLVELRVHESHVLQIRPGMDAFVTVDSIPDRRFKGRVRKVAVLPNSQMMWQNPNLKVYSTEVLIEDQLPDLKPGVSARAEIIVTNLTEVLTVPIQAVTTIKGQQVCFVEKGKHASPVPVKIGWFNDRFIEIKSALSEGDRVLLTAPDVGESIDLSGSIVSVADVQEIAKNPRPPLANHGNSIPERTTGPGAPNGDAPAPVVATGQPGASAVPNANSNQRNPSQRGFGGGRRGGADSPEAQKRREEFMKLSPEEREARMKQFRERSGQGGGPGGTGGGGGQGFGRRRGGENNQESTKTE